MPEVLVAQRLDVDLGWAKCIVQELERLKLSAERIEQLLDDLKDESATPDEFLDRNHDVARGPIGWLARISPATLPAIPTLMYMVYSEERSARLADQQLKGAQEQLQLQRQAQSRETEARRRRT